MKCRDLNIWQFVGSTAVDVLLDFVEGGNALKRFAGDGDGLGGSKTAHMDPAECELDVLLSRTRAVASISVDLEHAIESGEMRLWSFTLQVLRVDVGPA